MDGLNKLGDDDDVMDVAGDGAGRELPGVWARGAGPGPRHVQGGQGRGIHPQLQEVRFSCGQFEKCN